MTFTAIGSLLQGDNTTALSWTPGAVGDIAVVIVASNGSAATALSSTNATWTVLVAGTTVGAEAFTAFQGVATSTSASNVTVTASGSPTLRIGGQAFRSSNGSATVSLATSGTLNATGTAWPSLTALAGQAYVGKEFNNGGGGAVAGSTSGYVYSVDSHFNGFAYNVSTSAGATSPVWGDSDPRLVMAVLLRDFAIAAALTGTGTLTSAATKTFNAAAALSGTGTASGSGSYSAPGVTPMTVTGTQTGTGAANGFGLAVRVVTGALVPASQTGVTASGNTTTLNASVTPHAAGSQIYTALVSYAGSGGFTWEPAETSLYNTGDTTNNVSPGFARLTSLTPNTSAITVGASAGPGANYHFAAAEILSSGSLAEDASTPAVVYNASGTSVTTASFTPPAGALLVAMTEGTNVAGTSSVTISDTMGLTWTQLVVNPGSFANTGVWVARVPLVTPAAARSGTGILTAGATFPTHAAASLTGSGTLTSGGNTTHLRSAPLTGTGILSAGSAPSYQSPAVPGIATPGSMVPGTPSPISVAHPAAAVLSGSGTLSGTGTKTFNAAARLSGTGTLGGTPTYTLSAAAALTGFGWLPTAGNKTVPGAASLSGSGTMGATGSKTFNAAAPLSGAGALSAAGTRTARPAAPLSGSGTLSGTMSPIHRGSAPLSGTGALTAAGSKTFNAAAPLAGSGTLSAAGQTRHSRSVALSGSGLVTAAGSKTFHALAALSGTGTLSGTAHKTIPGAAALSGAGLLQAPGHKQVPGAAVLAGTGVLHASGIRSARGVASLSALALLGVQGTVFPSVKGTASLMAAPALAVAATTAIDPATLWVLYLQARYFADRQWLTWRMARTAAGTDGTAGFLYGKAYDAENASDAAYARWKKAHSLVYPGVPG